MEFKQNIFQCYISPTLGHFKNDWMARWNLSSYTDPDKPCVFFGIYKEYELQYLLNHRSHSIVVWAGGDICDENEQIYLNKIQRACAKPDCYHFPVWPCNFKVFEDLGANLIKLPIAVKNYSDFKPVPLGDKIYVYMGWKVFRKKQFNWESVITPIIEHFGKDKIIFSTDSSIEDIHENFYKKSFVNLKPNCAGGNTSMLELAHMGIKTITPVNQGPNCLTYESLDDIIALINKESTKIGSTQNEVAEQTKNFIINDFRWLNLDWLKHNY